MIYTPKQRALMELWRTNKLRRINLLEGSVSSGKTWISLVLWAFWVKTMPDDPNCLYLMSARSLTTLKRNCLLLLQSLVGEGNFTFSISAKEGQLFGRHILLEGANDAQAEAKIRGLTLQGAYCDELTKMQEDFFSMLLSRLRLPGAKLFATTNPDAPSHWLKADYIDRGAELDFLDVKFTIDDNTTLPPEYVENINREYTGVFYDRFILGKWVKAEGLVYPMFSKDRHVVKTEPRAYTEYCVSMDYGILNPTAMLLFGKCGDKWYLVKEFYHSGRDTNQQKTDQQYYKDLERLCEGINVGYVYIDPSAASFITLVRQQGRFRVHGANNTVIEGIQHTASVIDEGKLLINDCCTNTIREFGLYSWDDRFEEDVVIKESDHCLTGDTEVETLFGRRRIKELVGKIGLVWSYKKGRKVLRPFFGVRKTRENQQIYKITCENGKTIRCTGDHRILTASGWKMAKNLDGDFVIDIHAGRAEVVSVERDGTEDVYNMEVPGTHNFAINGGLIVHNCMDALRYFVQTRRIYRNEGHYVSPFEQRR